MPIRILKFKCWHADCASAPPLEIRVEVPRWRPATSATKEKTVQCERGHHNVITIPANWGVREPVLGDEGVLGSEGGVPVVQGRPA